MRHFPFNVRFYVKNINDLSCNYSGAIEVKQYCMLRKAKRASPAIFCAINLLQPIETDTLAMKNARLVLYHTLPHNIELEPYDARHPQSDNFFANSI